jgi:hypothetical protein
MGTYENCYEILADVRRALNEYSTAKVQGTDTTGAYKNETIIKKINATIREMFAIISRRSPGLFLEQADVTGVDSVFALPWDFGTLVVFKNEYGHKVYSIEQDERRLVNSAGNERGYYRKGQSLVLDKPGITKTFKIIYRKKPRNIHTGKASAGSASSITLSTTAPKIADYLKGMLIENVDKDWVDTISDYTAARVATVTQTSEADDYYGLVPEIPEWSHDLIAPRAAYLVSQESPVGQKRVSGNEYNDWLSQFRQRLIDYTDPGDTDWEELFTSYEPKVPPGVGIILPG